MKVCFENCDVMSFMARCDILDWKCCDEKLYGDAVLSIVRVIRIIKVLLRINELSCDYVQ